MGCHHTHFDPLCCPPGHAGTPTWQPQCEGLWVFSALRVKDYGLLTAFVWKKNISVRRVGAPANNSRSPEAWMFFDVLLSGAGPHKVEEHNQSSVRKGLAGLRTRDGSLNTGHRHRQEGETALRLDIHIHSYGSRHVCFFLFIFLSLHCCLFKCLLPPPLFSAEGNN